MNNTVDLHTHTTKSDGTFTPNELLKEASKKGLNILSITDHESVDAYYDIDRNLFNGMIIPGIELRTSCFGIAIELLGYGFDIDKMKETITKFHYKNTKEFDDYMIQFAYNEYTKKGVKLDNTFIQNYYDSNNKLKPSKYIQSCIEKYPENPKFLKDISKSSSFFRVCMTNPNSPLFLDFSTVFPNISELISSIKNAGGIVSIPHIFEYKESAEKILFHLLDNYNIDAIECYYSSFTQEQTKFLLDVCKKYNKFSSGGSDFHGATRPDVDIGRGKENNLHIPEETVKQWIDNLNNKL